MWIRWLSPTCYDPGQENTDSPHPDGGKSYVPLCLGLFLLREDVDRHHCDRADTSSELSVSHGRIERT